MVEAGCPAALRSIKVPVVIGGVDSDRLYPLRLQQELAEHIPDADGLHVISSPYGHDGFLLEHEAVAALVSRTTALAAQQADAADRMVG